MIRLEKMTDAMVEAEVEEEDQVVVVKGMVVEVAEIEKEVEEVKTTEKEGKRNLDQEVKRKGISEKDPRAGTTP